MTGRGYGQMKVSGRVVGTHRAAWELSFGPVPPGLMVCHHCDVKRCCNPRHLFLGTAASNHDDSRRKDRHSHGERHGSRTMPSRLPRGERHGRNTKPERTARGERHGSAKLSAAQVEEMRLLREGGALLRELATRYGVSVSLVGQICQGKLWGAPEG